jgi:hypothetical protein
MHDRIPLANIANIAKGLQVLQNRRAAFAPWHDVIHL